MRSSLSIVAMTPNVVSEPALYPTIKEYVPSEIYVKFGILKISKHLWKILNANTFQLFFGELGLQNFIGIFFLPTDERFYVILDLFCDVFKFFCFEDEYLPHDKVQVLIKTKCSKVSNSLEKEFSWIQVVYCCALLLAKLCGVNIGTTKESWYLSY